MTEFVGGAAHAPANHLVGILRPRVQPFLEIGGRRRQDEHANDIDACLLMSCWVPCSRCRTRRPAPPIMRLRPAHAASRNDCRTPSPIQAVRPARPSSRTSACRRRNNHCHRPRPAASDASSPKPTSSGQARARAARAWSCRRPRRRQHEHQPAPFNPVETGSRHRLLQVLDLLAELLDHVLHLQPGLGQFQVVRFWSSRC